MAKFGTGYIEIRGDSSKLKGDVQGGMDSVVREISGGLVGIKGLVGTLIGGAFALAIKDAVGFAAEFGDQMIKTAQKTGVAVEELSGLKYAADLSGTSLSGLQNGFKFLSKSMVEAGDAAGEKAKLFNALGIATKDAAGNMRPVGDVMNDLADKFAAMPDGAQKSTLAMQLLGRAGVEMIPYLNQGATGIKGLEEEAKLFGVTISEKFGRQAEAYQDNIERIGKISDGLKITIGEALIPALDAVISRGIDWYKANGAIIQADFRGAFLSLGNSITAVGSAFNAAGPPTLSFFKVMSLGLIAANTGITTLMTSIGQIGEWISTPGPMNAVFPGLTGLQNLFSPEDLNEFREAMKRMRLQSAEMTIANTKLAQSVWDGTIQYQYYDDATGKVTTDNAKLDEILKKLMADIAGTGKAAKETSLIMADWAVSAEDAWNIVYAIFDKLSPEVSDIITGIGAGAQRTFQIPVELVPEWSVTMYSPADAMETMLATMGGAGFGGLGDIFANAIDAAAFQAKLDEIANGLKVFTWEVDYLKDSLAWSFGEMFGDAVIKGIQGGGKAFLKALAGIVGGAIQLWGKELLMKGFKNFFSSLWPYDPVGMALGLKQIAAGTAITTIGAAIGGSVSGGSAGLSASGGASAGASPAAIAPIEYSTAAVASYTGAATRISGVSLAASTGVASPGSTVVHNYITIHATDADSFRGLLERHGADVIVGTVERSFKDNGPIRRIMEY